MTIVVVLAAAGGTACSSSGAAATGDPDPDADVVPVEVRTVARRTVTNAISYSGDVVGEVEIRVFAAIPDRIVTLHAVEGQRVSAGDVLAVVRSETLGQGVRQAIGGLDAVRAQVDGLRDTLARQRRLLTSGVVTQAQVDGTEIQLRGAESQVAQLEATVGTARTRRSDAVVRAPIAGIVGQVFVEEGDMASPAMPICTVVQMDRVEVLIQVSEADLGLVRPGMEADIRVATVPDRTFRAPVSRISPVVDRLSRTATLRIPLDNPEHVLRPGSLADVRIEVARHEDVVVVPLYALVLDAETGQRGEARYNAFVVEGETARERRVEVGLYDGDEVEIREGLEAGDALVVQGQHLLREGARIRHVRRSADAEGRAAPAGE